MHRYVLAAAAALALSATPAHAQQRGASRSGGGELSIHGIFAYYWGDSGVGIGARYQLPIVPEGILHAQVRDDIAIDFGADFVHSNFGRVATNYYYDPVYGWNYTYADLTWNAIIPTAGILWDFWITPQLALYPKLETGVAIGWWSGDWYSGPGYGGPHANAFFIQGAAGAKLKLNNGLALKAELGSGMLKLGVAFPL
jgi:hypothetical protein